MLRGRRGGVGWGSSRWSNWRRRQPVVQEVYLSSSGWEVSPEESLSVDVVEASSICVSTAVGEVLCLFSFVDRVRSPRQLCCRRSGASLMLHLCFCDLILCGFLLGVCGSVFCYPPLCVSLLMCSSRAVLIGWLMAISQSQRVESQYRLRLARLWHTSVLVE